MDIGIGLPATIPGVQRDQLLGWARRAEERGFSSLGTIDRLVYGNLESLVALAAALALGAGFVALAARLWLRPSHRAAVVLHLASLAYLALLFCAMGLDRAV